MAQPNFQIVSSKRKVVVTSDNHKGVTAIIGMNEKPFAMTILLRNGTEITIDKHNNTKVFTPMISEVF